jgi:hypothetical protein
MELCSLDGVGRNRGRLDQSRVSVGDECITPKSESCVYFNRLIKMRTMVD